MRCQAYWEVDESEMIGYGCWVLGAISYESKLCFQGLRAKRLSLDTQPLNLALSSSTP